MYLHIVPQLVSVANKTNKQKPFGVWNSLQFSVCFSAFFVDLLGFFLLVPPSVVFASLRDLPEYILLPSANDYYICFAHFFILMNSKNTRYTVLPPFCLCLPAKIELCKHKFDIELWKGTKKGNHLSIFVLIRLN